MIHSLIGPEKCMAQSETGMSGCDHEMIPVEVVYPLPEEQILYLTEVPAGGSVRDGILASGVLKRYPNLKLDELKVGIFGKLTTLKTPLQAKDRIEIYRPLLADPKEVRKQRAAAGKKMKKGSSGAQH